MRNWLMEVTEPIRCLREINVSGDPERHWTASFKAECLCLPVTSDGVPHRVDRTRLHRHDGSPDYVSVMALVQTILYEAGFAFINLVPAWGSSVSPELHTSQDARFISDAMFLREFLVNGQSAWNRIAEGRRFSVRWEDVPFQVLDPAAAASFPVEEDGDVLMLIVEEQELLGNAMVIHLRLAQGRPRASDLEVSRPEPKRRRGSLDAPLSIPSGLVPTKVPASGAVRSQTVGTSSLASGDAPVLTPDESMSSAGGDSQGSPGLGPTGAVAHMFVATAGPEGDSSVSVEQPIVYVPVAAYPPTPALTAPPDLSAAAEATTHEEVVEQEMNRSERKSIHRGREIEEIRRTTSPGPGRLPPGGEAQVTREWVASHREVEAIARDAERLRVEAATAAEAAAARARQKEAQSRRELDYQLREAHVRQVLETERRETQEAEIKALREQMAAASVRHHPQERNSSPASGGAGDGGVAYRSTRRQQPRRSNSRNGDASGTADRAGATAGRSVGIFSSAAPAAIPGSAPLMIPEAATSRHTPFAAYDAVKPFDPTLSLEKRRLWWDKLQYTALMGGWREQERCTRLYSRLSHNEGTKAWISSSRIQSSESPVERYLRLKQEARKTPRTSLWRLYAAAMKANVDYHTASDCRRHLNQVLKNLRDRELQLNLQSRWYLSTDEMEDTLRQREEMERGMCRKPANDIQCGRYKPPGVNPGPVTRGNPGAKVPAAYVAATSRESRKLSSDEFPAKKMSFEPKALEVLLPGTTVPGGDPEPRKVSLDEVRSLFRVPHLAPSVAAWDIRRKVLETHDVGPKRERLGATVDVAEHGGLWLAHGESQYLPISLGKHDLETLDVWADRGDCWVTLIVFSYQKAPVAARVVNTSKHTVEMLPHTRVATLTEMDRLPLGTNFVRTGSYQYEEREFLVYENTRSRRRLDAEARELERNPPPPPAVERPTYPRPTGILRRPDPSPGSRSVAMAVPSSSQTPSVQREDVSGATTTTYDCSESPGEPQLPRSTQSRSWLGCSQLPMMDQYRPL
ncbi:hypothetical protein PHYPSEUDO_002043 [Phytophthora pseudosyringae]|uniref:Uncharacterized protein n=1 Tax=Phytophthora pseudosyringae TaxID=221518 RepID=A0A8T1VUQ5_9STRA|nr:hypothetical protein PHYPSEUDO_002043 [Phytophthora pseudosyringae]